jgi:glycosyltransferase involved in cell wall biosynthesis
MSTQRKKVALWHRYGPADHVQCGGHCIPRVAQILAERAEVHYFGMKSVTPIPALLRDNAIFHLLPFRFHRASTPDKFFKTILWYFLMPFMALRCRIMGIDAIFVDETLPLTALIIRLFYGRNLALTVMDFFLDIYFENNRLLYPLCKRIKALDFASWRSVPVIYTRVNYTRRFLADHGVPLENVHTVYNPCDQTVYKPVDRSAPRARFGYGPDDVVLVHHGILHPNKGNDLIIRAIAELREELPGLRYLLIGDGPEMHQLKELAAGLHIAERVTFTGWLPSEQAVNEALNAGDIGLVMRIGQYSDNFHLTDTLAHEMAAGLPILAARLEGIAEVITDGETGFLFEPTGAEEFKAKLRLLCNDSGKRRAFSQSSRQLCHTFCDIESAAQLTAAPLLQLLDRK